MNIPFRTDLEENKIVLTELLEAFSQTILNPDFDRDNSHAVALSLERELSVFTSAKHAVALHSGTTALIIALMAVGVKPGSEVITVANTFVATVEAIISLGARPVFVDIDKSTGQMSPVFAERAINDHTSAILVVHMFGNAAETSILSKLAEAKKIPLVEDCAHAIGTRIEGKHAGLSGRCGCFSFHRAKNLGAISEGGAIITDCEEVATAARLLRSHGGIHRGIPPFTGLNGRISALEATALLCKLPHLGGWIVNRQRQAEEYCAFFKNYPHVSVPEVALNTTSSRHIFPILIKNRNAVRDRLAQKRIETRIHYFPSIDSIPAYRNLSRSHGNLEATHWFTENVMSLPLFSLPVDGAMEAITNALHGALTND